MSLSRGINNIHSIFVDTAPIIYYIEAHPQFGHLVKSEDIADKTGKLRGKYPTLKTIDALQIAAAIHVSAGAFLTNDKKLKKIKEIKIVVLSDYL